MFACCVCSGGGAHLERTIITEVAVWLDACVTSLRRGCCVKIGVLCGKST